MDISNTELNFARIINGELHNYLKNIDIVGRIDGNGDFIVFGCKNEDQERFYKGLLDYDKKEQVIGFKTVEDVKKWWEEDADMLFYIKKDDFELITKNM